MQKAQIGTLGVWSYVDHLKAPEAAAFANQLEEWGYGALWIPEAVGRDPFSFLGYLSAQTQKLVLATGIANIYARDPMTMNATRETLAETSGGRVLMGLGVSHGHLVAGIRKHEYGKPLSTMRAYLDAMDSALFMGVKHDEPAPLILAALRPKMLELSRERTLGAHPYFVPPEHTARAREILGPDAWLCPEQMVLRETDPSKARAIARESMKVYLGLPNYQNNLKWLGFEDSDFADGGSDRMVDAIVAWGDDKVIAERIRAHRDAGADHVCIQALRTDGQPGFDPDLLETFAPAKQ